MVIRLILALGLLFTVGARAADLLPIKVRTTQGQIADVNSDSLLFIDNRSIYLQPSQKGVFQSVFYFKNKSQNETPYLDVRISFAEGTYDFQVQQGDKEWVSIGTAHGQAGWQRLRLNLPGDPADLAFGKNKFKIRLVGNSSQGAAELDYLGISTDKFQVTQAD